MSQLHSAVAEWRATRARDRSHVHRSSNGHARPHGVQFVESSHPSREHWRDRLMSRLTNQTRSQSKPFFELDGLGLSGGMGRGGAWAPQISEMVDAALNTSLYTSSHNEHVTDKVKGAFGFVIGTHRFSVPFGEGFDVEAERAKVQKDLEYQQGFLRSVRGKLSNEKFVQGAPEAVVNNERKKEADALAKIAVLEEKLADLA